MSDWEKWVCEYITAKHGENVDNIRQLTHISMSGTELAEYIGAAVNAHPSRAAVGTLTPERVREVAEKVFDEFGAVERGREVHSYYYAITALRNALLEEMGKL